MRLLHERINSLKNFRSGRQVLLCLAALLFACCGFFFPGCGAWAAEAPVTVRVGYFYNGDFMHKTGDGSYEGYDIEYYYMIAGYANWKIKFVEFDGLQPALAAMERGEVDVMSGLSKTPEREAKFLVSSLKMCTAHIAVQTRADDDRFGAGDTDSMTGLTCGILKGSNVVTLYSDWCKSNGLVPHIVEYDSLKLRNEALGARKVDAIAAGSTIAGAQKIAEFPGLDLFFMFNKKQAALKAQLDKAMGILSLDNPTYPVSLFLKYFPSSRNNRPSFSAVEKAYIAAHPTVRVAVLEDDAPFSVKKADGSITGILPEYYAHLSQVTGMTFRCLPCSSKKEACAMLVAGEADLVGKFENDIYDAENSHVLLTIPFLNTNLVQVTRASTGRIAGAAVPECNRRMAAATLSATEPAVKITVMKNSEECFKALKRGTADSVVCTQPAASWLLNRNRASEYTVLAFDSGPFAISCAPALGADGNMLRSILDKTIAVDDGYVHQLIANDTLQDSADLASYVDSLPVSLISAFAVTAALLLVLAVTALLVIIRRRRVEQKLAAQRAELTLAEEANKARHAFFGSVSHDMRTPLNGIVGFANLALESSDPVKIKDYIAKIRASGGILTSLVNDMLVMSRMESGKYVLKPEPCDTSDLFEGILEPIGEMARKKGVIFEDNTASMRRRTVMADVLSLRKIFLNLLSNAVKFTPRGGLVKLDCRLEPAGGDQPDSVLVISDTGAGISREFLPRVFEPFAQENASNADTSGSGLGLSIVKSIVDAMGGSISVESEKGRGTKFSVRLHLTELKEAPVRAAAGQTVDDSFLKGKKALVCEDNELNLEILRAILEQRGVEVTGAANGKLGVAVFADSAPGSFDFILLDLRMPVMDGKTAARAIRALDRADARLIPIFAVSADAYQENIEECLAAGMNAHIAKPVDADSLVNTLSQFVGGQAEGRSQ